MTLSDGPQTLYLNADFDLRLRPRPRQVDLPAMVRQVRELSAQAMLGAGPDDAVLLRAGVPREYLEHLADRGQAPRVLDHPTIDPAHALDPFGWTADAMELNGRHAEPVAHPSREVLARVNARSFGRALEARFAPAAIDAAVVTSVDALEAFLERAPADSGWLVKSEFGHAGLANRRLRRPQLDAVDRRFVGQRLAEDDRLVVERWYDRVHDWCVVFDVPFDPRTVRAHETVHTRDGAPIGSLFSPPPAQAATVSTSDSQLERWYEPLVRSAADVAATLAAEGYFGPACVDAFTWRAADGDRLRTLVDLNCRRAMSDYAYRFWRRHEPGNWLYYRFFNRRKFALPADVAGLRADFAAIDRHAVYLASPPTLLLDGRETRPGKLAVMFVGRSREDVLTLDREFRERFEHSRPVGR